MVKVKTTTVNKRAPKKRKSMRISTQGWSGRRGGGGRKEGTERHWGGKGGGRMGKRKETKKERDRER